MADGTATGAGIDLLAQAVVAGDRVALGRAITLVESQRRDHREQAAALLGRLADRCGQAQRIGITGSPGVGKSTFIDALGRTILDEGLSVAVLAVDPSSARTGGSIMGDKTRMGLLANAERAFVRPSPSGGELGGVTRRTAESIQVCEAAGFHVVIVETVGVGQSETVVAEMVDLFCLLLLPGAGDALQGIKRGVLEHADLLIVNKADGDNLQRAARTRQDFSAALHFLTPRHSEWRPTVVTCSALTGAGITDVWATMCAFHQTLQQSGRLASLRAEQRVTVMWRDVEHHLMQALKVHPLVHPLLAQIEAEVRDGHRTPGAGALAILDAFMSNRY